MFAFAFVFFCICILCICIFCIYILCTVHLHDYDYSVLVAALSTGAATNLRRVEKENGDRDFGREEDEMAEGGQGGTLPGDLPTSFIGFIFKNADNFLLVLFFKNDDMFLFSSKESNIKHSQPVSIVCFYWFHL